MTIKLESHRHNYGHRNIILMDIAPPFPMDTALNPYNFDKKVGKSGAKWGKVCNFEP